MRASLQNGIAKPESNGVNKAKLPWLRPWTPFTPSMRPGRLTIDWNAVERDWEAFEKAENHCDEPTSGDTRRACGGTASRDWAKVVMSSLATRR